MVGAVLSSWSLLVMIVSSSAGSSDLSGQTSRRHRFLNPINVVGNLALGNRPKYQVWVSFYYKKIQNSCLVSFCIIMMTILTTVLLPRSGTFLHPKINIYRQECLTFIRWWNKEDRYMCRICNHLWSSSTDPLPEPWVYLRWWDHR